MSEFESDLKFAKEAAAAARKDFLEIVRGLKDEDLNREKRGGWPIRKVLEHAIHSEVLYSRLARHLCGLAQAEDEPHAKPPATVAEAVAALDESRAALEEAIAHVDEESFYKMHVIGREEYSVLSLLENVTLHDREHGPQIQDILASTS